MLRDTGCVIDLRKRTMKITKNHQDEEDGDELKIMSMNKETEEDILNEIERIVGQVEEITIPRRNRLQQILIKNKEVFSAKPGRINKYEH